MRDLKIGIIGLDTSHASAFTKLLNDPTNPFYIKGGEVTVAYPVGSSDFELSYSRIGGITKEVQQYGVQLVHTIDEVAEQSDAILLESVDGRVHLEQVSKLVEYRKPIFVDKPFALSSSEAIQMVNLSEKYGTPIMSSSALRFAEEVKQALSIHDKGAIIGVDCFGPMEMVNTQPGYFWYGIHTIEMLFTILGKGAQHVTSISTNDSDLIVSQWQDGRIGTARGNRRGNGEFGATIHFEKGNHLVSISNHTKPFYASLLEEIMLFFEGGSSGVPLHETVEIIQFIEAANKSRDTGERVYV
ncbi:Gfo/Idh/MocA family protein [Bacillus sinesaloumensis]|uniref:Gfo/Idh/MocA family protein n=1 Tax=Litchfieldia sinesaloumensis TaxID=1926280 RepID=UPI00098850F5|nr:Gfo/Idh/MocA family oxidoreductase [Bacillus sinesaloumensis]